MPSYLIRTAARSAHRDMQLARSNHSFASIWRIWVATLLACCALASVTSIVLANDDIGPLPPLPVADEFPLAFPSATSVQPELSSAQPGRVIEVVPPAELPPLDESAPVEGEYDSAGGAYAVPLEDEIWVVSTRHGHCSPHALQITQCVDHNWIPSSLPDLLASQSPDRPVVFWIHGNLTTHSMAISEGLQMYRTLKSRACRPFTFVIWSWCADRIEKRMLRDLKLKGDIAHRNAYPFGWLLAQFDPSTPLSVMGYSYGSRVALGGLQLMGGGHFMGHSLHDCLPPCRDPIHTVLIAAAVDTDGLMPGHIYGQALHAASPVLVYKNHRDPTLRWYPMLFKHTPAMGFVGPAGRPAGTMTRPVGLVVGRTHDWRDYRDGRLVSEYAPLVLFQGY